MSLKDSKTEQNLEDTLAGESGTNRRYLYFAAKADVEGYNDVAAVFRSTAAGETGTPKVISSTWKNPVIRQLAWRLAIPWTT